MVYLAEQWLFRTSVLFAVALMLALIYAGFDASELAQTINTEGLNNEHKKERPAAIILFFLLLLKISVNILVPALLALAIRWLFKKAHRGLQSFQ